MNYGLSKSAKIIISKSIFDVKNQSNFIKKKFGLFLTLKIDFEITILPLFDKP